MEQTIEQKLKVLYELQEIHSKIDKIRQIRGELPMEVADLEDDVAGLETRIQKLKNELDDHEDAIVNRRNMIKEANAFIKQYEAQLREVKNNREYDALTKELEIQNLEILVCEKKIRELEHDIQIKTENYNTTKENLDFRTGDLNNKRKELLIITSETEIEEQNLLKKAEETEGNIEERLLTAYKKLRRNAKNGLAVVTVNRNACSGCFNQVPPQRQADIRQHKKIIICEHCGRILIDETLINN